MARFRDYAERIDDATLRERVLIFAAALVVLVAGFYVFLINPLLAEGARLTRASEQQGTTLRKLQQEEQRLTRAEGGPAAADAAAQRVAGLRAELAALNERAASEQRRFTPAARMRPILEKMLARYQRLTLVELKTLPVITLSAGAPGPARRHIFQHGVQLTLKGSYADLYGYLVALEHLPTQLYWGRLELSAADYPHDVLKLTVYTVSFDKAWLVV